LLDRATDNEPTEVTLKHSALPAIGAGLFACALLGAACTDQNGTIARISEPPRSAERTSDGEATRPNVSVRWNELARALVASHNTNTPMASRVYALVSVAQFQAVTRLRGNAHGRDAESGHGVGDAGVDAAIARASADVLSGLYPDPAAAALISAELDRDERLSNGRSLPNVGSPIGDAIGADVARAVLARAATDGSADANCPVTPPLPPTEFWHDDAVPPNPQPLLPCFGKVRTWLGLDLEEFRAGPPPAFGSPAFLAGVAEVRQVSDTRTAEQTAIATKWLDGANTFSISGRWNLIASDLVTREHMTAAQAARLFAVLNMAMMDAHVACWDRKYVYWEIRPWQVDPMITTIGGKPHHPANPSGHSCAGGAGSGVLGGWFPAKRDSLFALGTEDGFSTMLAGVHYRFDVETGLRIGHAIAGRALAIRDLDHLLDPADRR
jgi:membrane-associated phospholipid phosphatase